MRIATHKNIRKYIYGLNTAAIYEKYGIDDLKILQFRDFEQNDNKSAHLDV